MIQYPLNAIPVGAEANCTEAAITLVDGMAALRLTLDEPSRRGTPGIDYVDRPTFFIMPDHFTDGEIEVDLWARLLPDAPDYARGFIGLAYRISDDLATYESVYLRPTNGRSHRPGTPRDSRAVQYYAFPAWPFDSLREAAPGQFESGADIALGRKSTFRVSFRGRAFAAWIDEHPVLSGDGLLEPQSGRVGLWVDIGTEGFFVNLKISRWSI